MIIKRYEREIKFHRVTMDKNRIEEDNLSSIGFAWLCTTQTATTYRNYLPWHECVPERQTVLFVGDTSGKTSRCSPVVIIHGTAPWIRDRNEFSRVWINKKSSDRVTSRSRDRSAPKTGFSFQILRSTIVFTASIIDSIDYVTRRLRNGDIVSCSFFFWSRCFFLSSPFIFNLAYFRFASLQKLEILDFLKILFLPKIKIEN